MIQHGKDSDISAHYMYMYVVLVGSSFESVRVVYFKVLCKGF